MKFHEYISQYDRGKPYGLTMNMGRDEWTAFMLGGAEAAGDDVGPAVHAKLEQEWFNARRPYYLCFAPILEPLARLSLDIPASFGRLPTPYPLAFRFPDPLPRGWKCKTAFVGRADVQDQGKETEGVAIFCDCGEMYGPAPEYWHIVFPTPHDETFENVLARQPRMNLNEDETTHVLRAFRVVVGAFLMSADPDILGREVLNRDRERYADSLDPKFVEKAERRGKIGWTLGAKLARAEMSPHYRRPHFAVRWTGPGRAVPVVRPIKGAVVHRKKLEAIPTGREDDETPTDKEAR